MTYKISGNSQQNARVYVINENTNLLETSKYVNAGSYEVDYLVSGTKSILAKADNGASTSYCNVPVTWGSYGLRFSELVQGSIAVNPSNTLDVSSYNFTTEDSLIFYGGIRSASNADERYGAAGLYFTNSGDTLAVEKYAGISTGVASTCTYNIVKFTGGIKSIQQGRTPLSVVPTEITINEVDIDNTICFITGWEQSHVGRQNAIYLQDNGTSKTSTLVLNTHSSVASPQVRSYWNVVEFEPSIIESIQRGTVAGNNTASINAVDLDNSILFYNGELGVEITTAINCRTAIWLSDSSTVSSYRYGTSGVSTVYFDIVQFKPYTIKSIQRGITVQGAAGNTVDDVTINAVNTSKTIVLMTGHCTNEEDSRSLATATLYDSTTVRIQRVSNAVSSRIGWQVIEFY